MKDELCDLWVSLRPEGTELAAYPEIVNLIFTAARLDAMRWTLKDGKWIAPDGTVEKRIFNGVVECVEAGTVHIGFPQVTKPKNRDLKPSEDLLRKMRCDSEVEAKRASEAKMREMVERSQADLASGKTQVDRDWKPGQPAVEVDLGGGKRIFVGEDKAPETARKKHALRDAKGHFARAAPPDVELAAASPANGPFGDIPRVTMFGEGHDPAFRPPIPQKSVSVEDILSGPSIQKPSA